MGKINFETDEASLLKAYKLSSLSPTKWEDVDVDLSDPIITNAGGADGDGDPLGLGNGIDVRKLDVDAKASILLSSKSFDPKAFLSAAHPNATYQDLVSGVSHLKQSIEARSQAMRILVEENFDRFVAVKASTDALYGEMKEGLLADDTEYASKGIREQLKLVTVKADQVFLPVLENASKAQKLRSTVGVFERSKFFFNLPGSLIESIEAGRYEVAMRDYKKGKFLLDSRPGQSLSASPVDQAPLPPAELQQRRIFDKVWDTVEKVMGEMRTTLLNQLKDPSRSVEEQEKTIEILTELSPQDEAIWVYFDSQHAHIMGVMKTSHDAFVKNVRAARDQLPADATQPTQIAAQLLVSVSALDTKHAESVLSKGSGSEVWQAIFDMTKNISDTLSTSLPSFWRIAKSYIDGKYKKVNPTSGNTRRSATQCSTMALDIVKLYISLISEFFILSDKAVTSTSDSAAPLSAFIPPGSDSLTTAFYLGKIINEISECVNDIAAVEMGGEAMSGLKNLLENARWKFLDALCETWLRDSEIFFHLETWVLNPENNSTTQYLNLIRNFQRQNTTNACRIAGGTDGTSSLNSSTTSNASSVTVKGGGSKPVNIGRDFIAKIQKVFLDSLYAFLDGLVRTIPSEEPGSIKERPKRAATLGTEGLAGAGNGEIDISNLDTCLLLVVSNLTYLNRSLMQTMINHLESACGVSISQEKTTLREVVLEMDKTLFEDYIKAKAAVLKGTINRGILESGMDWYETPRPTEVRSYMYEALMFLVGIHAHVSKVARSLLERTISSLVEDMSREALICFRQIRRFGMGGMLRATLEIEFMHQVLAQYVTTSASATLTEIYTTISAAYSRKGGADGKDQLQRELDGVKKTLHDSRRATAIEFLCFKAPRKEESKREGDNGKERKQSI